MVSSTSSGNVEIENVVEKADDRRLELVVDDRRLARREMKLEDMMRGMISRLGYDVCVWF